MKLTFLHVVGYITGILTFIAGLNPALVKAAVGPHYALFVVPVIAFAGAALVFLHDVGLIPTKPQPVISNIARAIPLITAVTLALVLPLAFGLSGCASTNQVLANLSSPAAQTIVTDAVDAAVIGSEVAGVPAVQINRIAKLALAADQGAGATVAAVAAVINAELAKLNLNDADVTAVKILQGKLNTALTDALAKNPGVANVQAFVADMLNEAITVTGG